MTHFDVARRFLDIAEKYAAHPAIVMENEHVTYNELLQLTQSWLALFSGHQQPRIAIALPPGAAAYAAMFASLLSGGTYTPINLRAPEAKRNSICSAFQPDFILAPAEEAARLSRHAPHAHLAAAPNDSPPSSIHQVNRDDQPAPAYVIFTSGSTGTPKGVVIGREALNHYIAWALQSLALTSDDRVSQYANIAFDLSVLEIFATLCSGASLHPASGLGDRLRPARLIARDRLTVWISVPSVVGIMQHAGDLTTANLQSIRRFTFCGEPLLPAHVEALFEGAPDAEIQNTYGPTEATVSMTSIVFDRRNAASACRDSVSLGHAIPGMAVHKGEDGELLLSGPQLADGYLNDPVTTARAFIVLDGPDGPVRAYRTGDRVAFHDGLPYFSNRLDFQIKHKGFRIELGEIVAAFATVGYRHVCVFTNEAHLVAIVEGAPTDDVMTLRQTLGRQLAAYAIPDIITAMPTLPRNENDKIDRLAIMARFQQSLPRTP
ncbi:non-ribosomal peptide synthetase [Neoasaia chiangmaiensis NBRC 101099]|uniref:Uncharacterized protein n=1 Tax=Neoasaia chiangmaiensis TaxID=320497 RepID=A0A1U9KND7_9PROT|nr:AMP-binding protein [Neoasaia chiangmaiensis]AQS87307.1 hypothetical protein A0U93_04420 [Neoasaia chiangmaiensis]GBR38616.1 non-ribosomal peptide synthetase [Neoasaia chiangmaiensis NBRC 101099]GEN15815.1 amino acid adenylation protein [Neoasaia chiangmaiensis]